MRDLLPMRELLTEVAQVLHIRELFTPITYSTVFEDNVNALKLANVPRVTPRSKHIAVKYHFFSIQSGPRSCPSPERYT